MSGILEHPFFAKWKKTAVFRLTRLTKRRIPLRAVKEYGLRSWLLYLCENVVREQVLEVAPAIRAVFDLDESHSIYASKEFRRLGLPAPSHYATAYRVAAMGVVLHDAATLRDVCAFVGLSRETEVYREIQRQQNRMGYGNGTARDVLTMARARGLDWLFSRYVGPLIPHKDDAVWQERLFHSLTKEHTP